MARRQLNLDEALASAKQFFVEVQASVNSSDAALDFQARALMFSSAGKGGYILDRAEAIRCERVISNLATALHNKFDMATIRNEIHETVLEILDPKNLSKIIPADRIKIAVKRLRAMYEATPKAWVTIRHISGLDALAQSISTPDVEFCANDSQTIAQLFAAFDRVTDSTTDALNQKQAMKDDRHRSFVDHFGGRNVAVVRTTACEANSAIAQAASTLDRTLNRINFLLDAIDRDETILRSERNVLADEFTLCLDVAEEQFAHQGHRVKPRTRTITQDRFLELIGRGAAKATWELITTKEPNSFQQRMLTVFQWAGSAVSDSDPSQAFLKRMIALELLLIGRKSTSDLQLRSQLYTAHLLGKRAKSRKTIVEDIGHLYDVRSQIVHEGQINVLPVDGALLREYLLQVLLVLIEDEPFRSMTERTDFDDWLKARLRGEDPENEQKQIVMHGSPI